MDWCRGFGVEDYIIIMGIDRRVLPFGVGDLYFNSVFSSLWGGMSPKYLLALASIGSDLGRGATSGMLLLM